MEIRAVVNEIGVGMELHGYKPEPILITLVRPSTLEQFRAKLAGDNPDMRYATIGQLAVMAAREMYGKEVAVSPYAWTFNASTKQYSH